MTPTQLRNIGKRLYGPHRWRSQLALNLGVARSTVVRWTQGTTISHLAEVAIRGLAERHKADLKIKQQRDEALRKAGRLRPKLRRRRI